MIVDRNEDAEIFVPLDEGALFTCPDCGEEVKHYDNDLCELCWWADAMSAFEYGEA